MSMMPKIKSEEKVTKLYQKKRLNVEKRRQQTNNNQPWQSKVQQQSKKMSLMLMARLF